ncbi:MAG: hypothetical protein H7Y18_15000 [Clostridiaceae bacterium]|nr:hypothetical protein [Clostridiaceae bacterium]
MGKDSYKKIKQTTEAIKIHSLNIGLLKSLLSEIKADSCRIQNKISNSNVITLEELEKLKKQENLFRLYANEKKSSLLEFENQLKLEQEKLNYLQQ